MPPNVSSIWPSSGLYYLLNDLSNWPRIWAVKFQTYYASKCLCQKENIGAPTFLCATIWSNTLITAKWIQKCIKNNINCNTIVILNMFLSQLQTVRSWSRDVSEKPSPRIPSLLYSPPLVTSANATSWRQTLPMQTVSLDLKPEINDKMEPKNLANIFCAFSD